MAEQAGNVAVQQSGDPALTKKQEIEAAEVLMGLVKALGAKTWEPAFNGDMELTGIKLANLIPIPVGDDDTEATLGVKKLIRFQRDSSISPEVVQRNVDAVLDLNGCSRSAKEGNVTIGSLKAGKPAPAEDPGAEKVTTSPSPSGGTGEKKDELAD